MLFVLKSVESFCGFNATCEYLYTDRTNNFSTGNVLNIPLRTTNQLMDYYLFTDRLNLISLIRYKQTITE